ncbi:MAG: YtxH domain-containing protein [Anaerolineae bacterium]|nr:MAG: YtxH domain-containing protein [Anaerolineae bacterium]
MNDYRDYPRKSNFPSMLAGVLIGGLAGAVTMLLLAPQSGEETRTQIRQKSIELRDRTTGMVEGSMAQVRSGAKKLASDSREKLHELKQHGQEIAAEQLDRVSEAAQAGKKAIQHNNQG